MKTIQIELSQKQSEALEEILSMACGGKTMLFLGGASQREARYLSIQACRIGPKLTVANAIAKGEIEA